MNYEPFLNVATPCDKVCNVLELSNYVPCARPRTTRFSDSLVSGNISAVGGDRAITICSIARSGHNRQRDSKNRFGIGFLATRIHITMHVVLLPLSRCQIAFAAACPQKGSGGGTHGW